LMNPPSPYCLYEETQQHINKQKTATRCMLS
jgi:hypothetical protein